MSFVLDASVTLAWCFYDEATPFTMALLERAKKETVFVPQIWPIEVGNIISGSERRKRISYAKMIEFIVLLEGLDVKIDAETSQRGFHEILSLAHSEGLKTYDASYLELAVRLGLPLATQDELLKKAAIKIGVNIITQSTH